MVFMTFSRSHKRAISWDVFGYYLYLPATFYHHDIALKDISWADAARIKYDLSGTLYQVHLVDGGGRVIQYTSGMAIMYFPAFVVGHYCAAISGHEQDGFSEPYQLAISIWSCLIALAGLFALRKILLYYFSDVITSTVLLLIVFATNYFITLGQSPALSHNYLFLCYTLLIWNTIQWHNFKKMIHVVGIALPLGMACLTRPTELVAIFIPLFWNTNGIQAVLEKIKSTWKNQRKQLLIFIGIMALCAMPQLIYWKHVTNHFVFNSYTNPGEGFDFLTPHTGNYLFSFRKGWFVYTPIMLVALFGLIYVWKKQQSIRWSFIIFIVFNLYIISSWSCWWYAHCYSQRAMLQSYPIMAILLGFVLMCLGQLSPAKKTLGAILISSAALLTVFQSWQYDNNILDGSRITKEYYLRVFGETIAKDEDKKLLLISRSLDGSMDFENREEYKSTLLYRYDTLREIVNSESQMVDTATYKGEWLSPEKAFSKEYRVRWEDLTSKDHCWLTVEADIFCPENFKVDDLCIVTTFERKGDNYGYAAISLKPDSLKANAWNKISYSYLTPEVRSPKDRIKVYAWYRGQGRAFLRNITVLKWESFAVKKVG